MNETMPLFIAAAFLIIAIATEAIHTIRVRRLAHLAFGPSGRPASWVVLAAPLRVLAIAALAWGFATLLMIEPKTHNSQQTDAAQQRHVVLLLDVSPSMRLVDAGPEGDQSRMQRARVVLESFFDRVPIRQYKVSVVAFYNEAIPVVIDTKDLEVVRNTLNDLPMHYAFTGKDTNLFKGLEKVTEIAKPWEPDSAVLLVITDGDTVPGKGMPKLPTSVRDVLVIGVGDPVTGKFIAGKNSRQDISALRQVATRLGGVFQNANNQHVSSTAIAKVTQEVKNRRWQDLSQREYALVAISFGAFLIGTLPILLYYLGTFWRPGVR